MSKYARRHKILLALSHCIAEMDGSKPLAIIIIDTTIDPRQIATKAHAKLIPLCLSLEAIGAEFSYDFFHTFMNRD